VLNETDVKDLSKLLTRLKTALAQTTEAVPA
jgi:hypothetical protein